MSLSELHMMGCRAGVEYHHRCKFLKTDAGRSGSKRPRQNNDCTVRALASTCDLTYDQAYDLCAVAGRKVSRGFDMRAYLKANTPNGFRSRWIGCPAVKGDMTIAFRRSRTRLINRSHSPEAAP